MMKITEDKTPKHVGIIMDGNGRWAEAQGLPRSAGHLAGYENAKNLVPFIFKKGIEVVTVYAFSTENWQRKAEEVNFLFDIFRKACEGDLLNFAGDRIRIRFIGNRADLISRGFTDLTESMGRIEKETSQNIEGTFVVAINYGGREEIVHAMKEIRRLNVHPAYINESAVSHQLYTAGLPDADLIIRTAGERRISNFLLWQGAYAEFYHSRKPWPAFGREDFSRALKAYWNRKRKFGGY